MVVDETAITYIFRAIATPTADVAHKPAAVVRPLGKFLSSLKIIPAPINPKPVAIAANILAIADLSSVRCAEIDTKRHAATQMQANVRMPVFCCSLSLSIPIMPPRSKANRSFAESKSSN